MVGVVLTGVVVFRLVEAGAEFEPVVLAGPFCDGATRFTVPLCASLRGLDVMRIDVAGLDFGD